MNTTIIPVTSDDAPWLWMWGTASDALLDRANLHCVPIIAWEISSIVLPITPSGRAEPGGAWLIATGGNVGGRYITSDGEILENQQFAKSWLQERSAK